MINLDDIIRQLTANAEAIRALLQTVSDEQAEWKPDDETWSLKETMTHIYNEERIDFRKHLQEMLEEPTEPWGEFHKEDLLHPADLHEALQSFVNERADSLAWLTALESPDWDTRRETPWGRSISAGDVLVSWAEHDYLHLRQLNELLHAWNARQGEPYSVEYGGGW